MYYVDGYILDANGDTQACPMNIMHAIEIANEKDWELLNEDLERLN